MSVSSENRRILALWLPRLPIDRLRRYEWKRRSNAQDELPLVTIAKVENSLIILAVDAKAEKLGLAPGFSLADARARLPALNVVEANEHADREFLEVIANWCDRFTPLVALDPPYGIFLDITGCAHLFGGEQIMLAKIHDSLSEQGLEVHIAIAGTAAAARALARCAERTIVVAGEEERVVSNLPVAAMPVHHSVITAFKRAGLRTVGDVASRSRTELSARFGAAFVFVLEQLLGKADSPISPRKALPDYIIERSFPEPIATADTIEKTVFLLSRTLEKILEEQGKGARSLELTFFRSDGIVRCISAKTARPLKNAETITRLFHERLDALADPLDPGFGFDLIRLTAVKTETLDPEALSFHANEHDAHEISFLIDRLSARFGAGRVLRFHAQDTHIPEDAGIAVSAQRSSSETPWEKVREIGEPPRRPLRMLAQPEQIEVIAEVPEGPPAQFIWRKALHLVVRSEGPERIAMEWWRTQITKPTRDYFQVEDKEGLRFWLYRDGLYSRETNSPAWYMHGLFA